MACPDDASLSAFHDAVLPEEAAGPLRRHLEACPACVSRLEALRRLDAEVAGAAPEGVPHPVGLSIGRPRILPWAAAAAAGLVAVLLWKPQGAPVPSLPPAEESRYRFLAPGTSIRLSEDARMDGLDLRSGSALVSADPGPVEIGIPAGKVRLESGTVLIEPARETTACLLRDAWASEPAWSVSVLKGEAVLASLRLKEGQSARWAPGSSPEPRALQAARSPLGMIPETGWNAGDLPEGRYALEARLTPESMPKDGDVGIAYRAGGKRAVWWLRGGLARSALGRDPLSGEVRVRIVVDRDVAVFVNGKACGRIPFDRVREAEGSGPVRITRGRARTDLLRWRPLG